MFLHVKYIKEMFVKKRTLLFLSLCASALNAQLVQADMVNAPSSQVSSSQVAETGGQLSVVDEAGQIKAILSNIQGEIIGVTAQFSSETNSGITVTFSMDEQGRYVAVLDRSAFAEEDQVFSLKLTAQLTDGSFQTLSDYSFEWKKDVVSAAEKPTALDNSDATPSKIEEEATSTTTSSTVNSSLTAGATSSTSNSLTRSSSNTIAGSSNGSTSVPSARVSTASSSINVTQPTGTITIENRNDAQGTFDVRVTNVSSPKDISSVILPTWSQSDDLRWYEATRQPDGSYKLTVNKKDHKYRTGTYTVHLYYKDSNGGLTGAGGTTTHLSEVKPTGTITIENRNDAQGTFDVRVTNVSSPKDISSVILPTWSQSDDLRWYEATRQPDGSYKLTVNKKDHKYRTGTYTVHLYYKDPNGGLTGANGGLTGAGGTTTHLSEVKPTGTITIENRNDAQGTFDVRVTNVSSPKDISSVILPTWSQTDDLRWYEATRQSDGSYKLTVNKKDHKYRTGTYTVHLYYKDSSGGLTGAGGTTTHLSEVKPTGTITIENRNDAQGTFDVRVTNVSSPKDISSVILPTWSQTDDLRWYEAKRQADGSYKLTVNKKDHKYRTGTYTVHLYYKDSSGGLTGAGGTTTHLSEMKPTGTITIENRNDAQGTFDVRVTNVSSPKDIASVILPTWSQTDDLRWYEAKRQADGSYKLTVNKRDHKYRTGTYTVHLYYKDSNGGLTGAGGTTTHLSEVKPTGTITIENRNDAQGTFDVRVTNVSSPKDIASVILPTWSQTDDLRWYEATRQSDGSYKLTVNKKDHKYRTGTYTVHLYYKDSNGGLTGAGGTTTHLSNPSAQRSYTVYIDPGHGGRDSGASYGGVHEKNLALSVSNKLRENLLQYGINVLMTRTGDYDVDFKTERSRMTNASNADLFISIHFNATGAGVSNATGIETYWYQYNPEYQPKINKEMHNNPTRLAESEILANKVQESLIKETGAVNRGVRRETFAVLRETAIPAILVELGFMDNPSELQVIKQDSYHTRLAKALAQGVMNWYGAVEGK
ncbi:GBS Bsp-like repeat-containing protein [Streptococcus suis]|uniref:GBS Bsp-like repeat-containing protein n=1 Tax=Streptococcus suis TaxID=1307 RepID=UPI003F56B135